MASHDAPTPPGGPAPEVDAFLAKLSGDTRAALDHIRKVIRGVVPDAVEGIGYGVPAFKLRGRPLVSFGAGKNHCALYVQSPAVLDAHRDRLAGYDLSKGTIRFRPGAPLPDDLVEALVRARMAEVGAGSER